MTLVKKISDVSAKDLLGYQIGIEQKLKSGAMPIEVLDFVNNLSKEEMQAIAEKRAEIKITGLSIIQRARREFDYFDSNIENWYQDVQLEEDIKLPSLEFVPTKETISSQEYKQRLKDQGKLLELPRDQAIKLLLSKKEDLPKGKALNVFLKEKKFFLGLYRSSVGEVWLGIHYVGSNNAFDSDDAVLSATLKS